MQEQAEAAAQATAKHATTAATRITGRTTAPRKGTTPGSSEQEMRGRKRIGQAEADAETTDAEQVEDAAEAEQVEERDGHLQTDTPAMDGSTSRRILASQFERLGDRSTRHARPAA